MPRIMGHTALIQYLYRCHSLLATTSKFRRLTVRQKPYSVLILMNAINASMFVLEILRNGWLAKRGRPMIIGGWARSSDSGPGPVAGREMMAGSIYTIT